MRKENRKKKRYTIIVDEEEDGFVAYCEEEQGAVGQGDSIPLAVYDLMNAVVLLEQYKKADELLPKIDEADEYGKS